VKRCLLYLWHSYSAAGHPADALAQVIDVLALAAHAEVRTFRVGPLLQHLALRKQFTAQLLRRLENNRGTLTLFILLC